jgi:quercetin dioxygenase-like cupin family protein
MRLKLMGNSRTNQEQDPLTSSASVKDIYVLVGKMSVIIRKAEKESRINLKKGQSFSFDARQPHYFENTSDRMNETLIVHAPVKNSVFFAS